jgi:uncharacterized protein YpmB
VPDSRSPFSRVKTPDGCTLRRKEQYEYVTPRNVYHVELFENQDGTFYAVGVPKDSNRLIVYGSNTAPSPEQALQVLVDKIQREGAMLGEEADADSALDEDAYQEEMDADS